MKSVKSARGQIVDFDLIRIKEQMASAPKTVDVKNREDYIERRNKRRLKKLTKTAVAMAEVAVEPKIVSQDLTPVEPTIVPEEQEVADLLFDMDQEDHDDVHDEEYEEHVNDKKQPAKRITK